VIILTEKETELIDFREAAKTLVKWLNENCRSDATAIISQDGAFLLETRCTVEFEEYLKD
jgi:hypothetical protein